MLQTPITPPAARCNAEHVARTTSCAWRSYKHDLTARLLRCAGFIPNSMVAPSGRPEEGQSVRALFVEVDELQNRMILSQRQLLQAELLKSLQVGSTVEVRDQLNNFKRKSGGNMHYKGSSHVSLQRPYILKAVNRQSTK
jgi:hypothetical protein